MIMVSKVSCSNANRPTLSRKRQWAQSCRSAVPTVATIEGPYCNAAGSRRGARSSLRWSHLIILCGLCWWTRRGCLVASITTFKPPLRLTSGSTMALFGFRERFFSSPFPNIASSVKNSPPEKLTQSPSIPPNTITADLSLDIQSSSFMEPPEQKFDFQSHSSLTTTITVPSRSIFQEENPDAALFTLPAVDDSELSPLSREFRGMVLEYSNFTERDVLSISDLQSRTILEGVVASARVPAIYRAFEVAFEDIYPLRLAGRIIHSKLKQSIRDGQLERDRQVEQVRQATGLDQVDETRLVFVAIAVPLNGKAYLTREQLEQTSLTGLAVHTLGFNSGTELMERIDPQNKSHIDFTQLVMGLHDCAVQVCGTQSCHAPTVVQEIMMDLVDHPPTIAATRDSSKQRYIDRFDYMVMTFKGWKSLVPTGRHRRILDVINGCFVGAENEPVLEALRVCYVEYSGLRLAGDIIFKLAASILNSLQRQSSS